MASRAFDSATRLGKTPSLAEMEVEMEEELELEVELEPVPESRFGVFCS